MRYKLKRVFLLTAFILLCALFSGCTKAEIDCGIDENHTAYLKIDLNVDLSDLDTDSAREAENSFSQLAAYYEAQGFAIEGNLDSWSKTQAPLQLTMTLQKETDSDAEAFSALKDMLCNEKLTPFTAVSMFSDGGETERGFSMTVQCDADRLLKTAGIDQFPQALQKFIGERIDSSTATLRISLPATTVEDYSGTLEQAETIAAASTDISFTQQTELKLVTRAHLQQGETVQQSAADSILQLQKQNNLLLWGQRIAIGILAVCVILFIILLRRRKKA